MKIRVPKGAQGEEVGTAIFIAKGNEAYLLIAAHIISNFSPQAYVVLSNANGAL